MERADSAEIDEKEAKSQGDDMVNITSSARSHRQLCGNFLVVWLSSFNFTVGLSISFTHFCEEKIAVVKCHEKLTFK